MEAQGTSLRDFKVIQKLGQGSFSQVYKVQRIGDTKQYAMKKVKINQMKDKQKENSLNEVRILASICHPNIINYKQAFFDQKTQTLCVVMELADAGDIQKKIDQHKSNNTYFNQVQVWQALVQMAKGLKVLHDIHILHRDLKCANVFCTKDGKYKLGDLNVSKVAKRGMARTQAGTPYYTSPQVWNDRAYDSKCDIWSLGCVVYEMTSLNPPFRANNLKQLYNKIQKGIYPNIPPFYSEDLKYIISQCLKVNSASRPSAFQLLQHPKVLKNMPSSEAYNKQNIHTSKAVLLKTILVPKNMKQLKEALPKSKYDTSQSLEKKYRRANSAQNLRSNDIPCIITPKGSDSNRYNLKYALLRRPSTNTPNQKSDIRELSRNNSNSNIRQNIPNISEQTPSLAHRNNSVDHMRNRVNSKESGRGLNNSRKSGESKEKTKNCMEDISNRCRQIEQRVRHLMQKKRQAQQQRNPNIPSVSKHIVDKASNRNRDVCVIRSRNSSISRNNSCKSIEVDRSGKKLSREKNDIRKQDSKKGIKVPPRYK